MIGKINDRDMDGTYLGFLGLLKTNMLVPFPVLAGMVLHNY
jgi:hypothetical protein